MVYNSVSQKKKEKKTSDAVAITLERPFTKLYNYGHFVTKKENGTW